MSPSNKNTGPSASDRGAASGLHSRSPRGGCEAFHAALEEFAFYGREPARAAGDLRSHLDSCPRCARLLKGERMLYGMPPELKPRVFEELARQGAFDALPKPNPSWPRRVLRALTDALSRTPRRRRGDDLESRIRKATAAGDPMAAATEAIRGVGPSVLGYLRAVLGDEADAEEAFSRWAEDMFRGMQTRSQQLSLRAWAFRLARQEALNLGNQPYRRSQRPRTAESAAIADDLRANPVPTPEGKWHEIHALRESLTAEERSLLVLRLDRGLPWKEIAQIMAQGGKPADATALSRHFEQIKVRLVRLARDQGLLR